MKGDKPTEFKVNEIRVLNDLVALLNQYQSSLTQLKGSSGKTFGKSIRACKHKKTYQYYIVDHRDKKPKYVNAHEPKVRYMIQQEYNADLTKALDEKITRLSKMVDEVREIDLFSVYSDLTDGRKPFIESEFLPPPVYARIWQMEDYPRKEIINADVMQKTQRGEYVRSKSELLIANELYSRGIPYKYERPLEIGGFTYHPDFTVLNPRTGQEMIWEHFGLIDDMNYRDNMIKKLRNYANEGYLPGKNLIISFETQRTVLTKQEINDVIIRFLS